MINLENELNRYFGYNSFRPLQKDIIESLISGKDVFVLMPTGAGKSLCYQLPAMVLDGVAIVVSPLISLMKDQVDSFGSSGVVRFLNSTLSKIAKESLECDLRSGKVKLLYIAPETLRKSNVISLLSSLKVSFFAVDEAHCISEWGHEFRPSYLSLHSYFTTISSNSPIIALTATATPRVLEDIITLLSLRTPKIYKTTFDRPNLDYIIRSKTSNIDNDILTYIRSNIDKSGIIYCFTRQEVDDLTNFLISNGISVLPYHAGLNSSVRKENQEKFLSSQVSVIVSTTAFGMGINKPDIRYIIHYSIPNTIECYYQETGRAGRDGNKSECIAFYSYSDIIKYKSLNRTKNLTSRKLFDYLLTEVVNYCESTMSHRDYILKYFGESPALISR